MRFLRWLFEDQIEVPRIVGIGGWLWAIGAVGGIVIALLQAIGGAS